MTIDRTLILRERAQLTYDGETFFSGGNTPIVVTPVFGRASIQTTSHGKIEERITDRVYRVSLTPSGQWAHRDALYGPLEVAQGGSLIGATDKPLVFHTISGTKFTFNCAAITKMPTLTLAAGQPMFGPMEFMCVLEKSGDPSSLADYYSTASVSYPGDDDFDPAAHLTLAVNAVWGDTTPWSSFLAETGWVIEPVMQATPEPGGDGIGTVDYKLANLTVTAKAVPVGITKAAWLAKLHEATALGARRTGTDLVLSASGIYVKLNAAILTDGDAGYGDRKLVGQCTWEATRTWTTGVVNPLLTLLAAAPA